jgi:ribosomal protein S18 acetylase RimI-like enzyme
MKTLFSKDKWLFELTIPEYETAIFGGKMGELRLTTKLPEEFKQYNIDPFDLDGIYAFLLHDKILACTFRGKEEINLVRTLNELGFMFVGTYSNVSCKVDEFTEILLDSDLEIRTAQLDEDFVQMKYIKSRVFDYSTHQLDPKFTNNVTSHRNVLRLSSYFNNPKHLAYVAKSGDRVVGYLQFIIDGKKAYTVNGAIDPDYQGMFIGGKLYSMAFKKVFYAGVDVITSGYCNQNTPVVKIHQALNFKVTSHEIHLRLHI